MEPSLDVPVIRLARTDPPQWQEPIQRSIRFSRPSFATTDDRFGNDNHQGYLMGSSRILLDCFFLQYLCTLHSTLLFDGVVSNDKTSGSS